MAAVVLGLGSSLLWGLSDFLGGLQSRRHPVLVVLLVSQGVGLTGVLVAALARGQGLPETSAVLAAAGAGVAGLAALGAFYRALSIGTMSVVAPISGTAAAIPVTVGVLTGERPGPVQVVGMFLAVAGIVLASREGPQDSERAAASREAVGLALLAALGFGLFFVGMDHAADRDVLWALVFARAADIPVLLAFVLVLRPAFPRGAGALAPMAGIGVLDLGANALYAQASTTGLLSVVSVLGSLYPAVTVLLARVLLGERLRRAQGAGVTLIMLAVVAIAAG